MDSLWVRYCPKADLLLLNLINGCLISCCSRWFFFLHFTMDLFSFFKKCQKQGLRESQSVTTLDLAGSYPLEKGPILKRCTNNLHYLLLLTPHSRDTTLTQQMELGNLKHPSLLIFFINYVKETDLFQNQTYLKMRPFAILPQTDLLAGQFRSYTGQSRTDFFFLYYADLGKHNHKY